MPRLQTARLVLQPVEPLDAPALHRHWTAPEVRRYLWDDETIALETVREIVAESRRQFLQNAHGLWALCTVAHDLVGVAGFWPFHDPPRLELIISLGRPWWGQGFAEESGRALIAYAFETLGWDTVRASTDAPNRASVHLIQRLGMRAVADATVPPGTLCYALSRATYQPGGGDEMPHNNKGTAPDGRPGTT